ncbi:hypothetical protein [Avibacterium volantium]|uniref:Glycosyl transferases group 1 n=1 Tax=Avibacterium volantium TaxID=762 RepID=A0A3S4H638_AVIVO|nr:hypothetical protein [Avibacterium volantium]VEB24921.1 Uncharacterised protein [Avibacterium volantium]
MKKKIIVVSTFFPPREHIASHRIESFAKYLSQRYEVIVITYAHIERIEKYYFDSSNSCQVLYISNGFFQRILEYTGKESNLLRNFKTLFRVIFNKLNISHFRAWEKKVEKKIVELINLEDISVILSSYYPESALEASYNALIKTKSDNIKWVVDFRDEYSRQINISSYIYHFRRERERKYSERADVLTTISEPHLNSFREDMPNIGSYIELRNGFDHDFYFDYEKDDFFKIGYFGSFYGDRKPDIFFEAVKNISHLIPFKIFIATSSHNFYIPDKIREKVVLLPYLSYKESIVKMSQMDCNLLILPRGKQRGIYSGKLFDYISVGRSVLALVDPSDVAAKLIEDLNCGYISEVNDVEAIEKMINRAYLDWINGSLAVASKSNIDKLHRKYQVEKLINIL